MFLTVIAALARLATPWVTSLNQGFGGIPYPAADALGPRLLLPLHCLVAGLVAAFTGALGDAVESVSEGHLETFTRWLLVRQHRGVCGDRVPRGAGGGPPGPVGRGDGDPGPGDPACVGTRGPHAGPRGFLWLLVVAAGAGCCGVVLRSRRPRRPLGGEGFPTLAPTR
ncbi:hypothetical protein AB0F91_11725 [Amycolatopsis sp. NPDC023774]|uniref:hypothetical protein n=1 Tax=Amycolatopsis sp. NPDC023774 TaxID=3155015 RepID=UPI0033E9E3E5